MLKSERYVLIGLLIFFQIISLQNVGDLLKFLFLELLMLTISHIFII